MTTKLTLSIDKKVIERSKAYAASKNRSLSDLVEQYLRSISSATIENPGKITRKVASLRGSIKSMPELDYKQTLKEEILKKHG